MDWQEKLFFVVAAKPLEIQVYQYLVLKFYTAYRFNEMLNGALVLGVATVRGIYGQVRLRA